MTVIDAEKFMTTEDTIVVTPAKSRKNLSRAARSVKAGTKTTVKSGTSAAKFVGRKTGDAAVVGFYGAKFVGHKASDAAVAGLNGVKTIAAPTNRKMRRGYNTYKTTVQFIHLFGGFLLKVLWYMLILQLLIIACVAVGLPPFAALLPFYFLVFKGII